MAAIFVADLWYICLVLALLWFVYAEFSMSELFSFIRLFGTVENVYTTRGSLGCEVRRPYFRQKKNHDKDL